MSTYEHAQHVEADRTKVAHVDSKTRYLTSIMLSAVIMVLALISPTPSIADESLDGPEFVENLLVQK
jgi:hypothetical protein